MTPENHPELEASVLGSIILASPVLLEIVDILTPECFFNSSNRIIYEDVILSMYNNNENIDLLTVVARLKKENLLEKVGGPIYITSLSNTFVGAANIVEHAYLLKGAAIKREIGLLGAEMNSSSVNPELDPLDLLSDMAKRIDNIGLSVTVQPFTQISTIIGANIRHIEEVSKLSDDITGVPTGFGDLDRITHGWQKSDLIILAARPSMGKTTLALNMAENAAVEYGYTVAMFSLEMSKEQLGMKLMSSQTGIPLNNIKYGRMSQSDWDKVNDLTPLINSNILIDEQGAITPFEMKTKLRKLKHDNPELAMVIVDYLQLMSAGKGFKGSREQEISYISRSLKLIAKELNLPVIALSQLSRAVESRGDKKPQLSDLRDSGAIEQDADIVSFVYRPEYYGFTKDADEQDLTGKAQVLIAKNRNGTLGDAVLNTAFEVSRFENEEKPF
ncbi:replicative DNA helicase [Candidatus Bathyarchaeota archaeon]|nr:MAG: replicative DNA helicase [Candidatus Bathyarchaeota archaeon]